MEKKIKKVVTDNPQGNIESLLNFAHDKEGKVVLISANGEREKDLSEYIAELSKEVGCDCTAEEVMDGMCLSDCGECYVAILNICAIQAAELREKLRNYERRLDEGTLIELPCKIGEEVYALVHVRNNGWQIEKRNLDYRDIPFIGEYVFADKDDALKRQVELGSIEG